MSGFAFILPFGFLAVLILQLRSGRGEEPQAGRIPGPDSDHCNQCRFALVGLLDLSRMISVPAMTFAVALWRLCRELTNQLSYGRKRHLHHPRRCSYLRCNQSLFDADSPTNSRMAEGMDLNL